MVAEVTILRFHFEAVSISRLFPFRGCFPRLPLELHTLEPKLTMSTDLTMANSVSTGMQTSSKEKNIHTTDLTTEAVLTSFTANYSHLQSDLILVGFGSFVT